jgi:hypothetical protein
VQASPSCVQKDGLASQMPFVQSLEQQSALPVHGLPLVLQFGLSGVQLFEPPSPPPHVPPQHCESEVHAWLSAVHWVAPHEPPVHAKVQHSGPAAHAAPAALHVPFPGPPSEEAQPASSQLGLASVVLSTAAVVLPQPANAKALDNAANVSGKKNFKIVRVMPTFVQSTGRAGGSEECEKREGPHGQRTCQRGPRGCRVHEGRRPPK